MHSELTFRALPLAGGAMTALALGFALDRGFRKDAATLSAQLADANDRLVQLDYRVRHPEQVAEQERKQQVTAHVQRLRPLHRLRDEPTTTEEITARFSVCNPLSNQPVPLQQLGCHFWYRDLTVVINWLTVCRLTWPMG